MKKTVTTVLMSLFLIFAIPSFAQVITPPGDGAGGTSGHDPVGGGAPIGSGLALVLGLGLAYGAKKTLQLKEGE